MIEKTFGPMPPLEVKRYANRKVYVPERGRYVNFAWLYNTLRGGRDISVRCVETGNDVTSQVLGMIYQQMCINTGYVEKANLMKCIRTSGPEYDASLS